MKNMALCLYLKIFSKVAFESSLLYFFTFDDIIYQLKDDANGVKYIERGSNSSLGVFEYLMKYQRYTL